MTATEKLCHMSGLSVDDSGGGAGRDYECMFFFSKSTYASDVTLVTDTNVLNQQELIVIVNCKSM